jgi:RimJ/RimL family protein N-acetyltransferase
MAPNEEIYCFAMLPQPRLPTPGTLSFSPLTEEEAHAIQRWRYPEPYAIYNLNGDPVEVKEMLDRRSPHYAVRDDTGDLIAFFAFGSSAEVGEVGEPHLYTEDGGLSVGLGLHPDRTGRRLGLSLVIAGLALGRQRYHPAYFRLFVLTWNTRAIRVYERAGFVWVGVHDVSAGEGMRHFFEMRQEK